MLSFNSSNIASKTRTISRRMFLLNTIKGVVLLGILGRLATLQINEVSKYRSLADKNRFRQTKFAPPRGIIEDYFGNEIASNARVYQLHITPENTPNIDKLLVRLKNLISLSDRQSALILKKIKKQKKWETIIISDNLSWKEFTRLNLFLHELEGAQPVVSIARVYKNNASAHAIGYVSEISPRDIRNKKYLRNMNISGIAVGKTGLESTLDEDMLGSPGFLRYEVNAFGKKIRQVSVDKGSEGKTFRTTLDDEVQVFSAKLLENVSGATCVMDIYSGDIVSMVSSPTFNPNSFIHGINKEEWNGLLNNRDKPMINKAISGLYPPGSTIKTLTALSALENDVVSSKLIVECKGFIDLHGERFHCWKKKGHGVVGMRTALKKSCDIYFYEVARLLGIDRLQKTAFKFGLGNYVFQNFFEEAKGLVPSTSWKREALGKSWYLGETMISGIGQGYIKTTNVQLCKMIAQFANGGYQINASFFDSSDLALGKKIIEDDEHIELILKSLFEATNHLGGTSYRSRIAGTMKLAGKTGTAQVRKISESQREQDLKNKDLPWKFRDHSLFTGYGPADNPKYAISVVIEHGGSGSAVAAPIARNVMRKIFEKERKLNNV